MFSLRCNGICTLTWATILTLLLTALSKGLASEVNSSSDPSDVLFGSVDGNGSRGAVRRNLERALAPGKGTTTKPSGKSNKKSSKKGKGNAVEVCLQTALLFSVEGSNEAISGPTNNLLDMECATTDFNCPSAGAGPTEKVLKNYIECAENAGILIDNWYFNREYPGNYEFVQTPSVDQDGSYKGSILTTDGNSKLELEYINQELQDESVGLLTNIAFDYYIEKCPSNCAVCSGGVASGGSCATTPLSCLKQLYVNIYTRKSDSSFSFYDCQYDFVLGVNDLATDTEFTTREKWHAVSFNPLTATPSVIREGSSNTDPCPATLQDASLAGFVLASKFNGVLGCDFPLSIKLSIGDRSCVDAGMVAYYDNIRIDFEYRDGSGSHLYNMVAP